MKSRLGNATLAETDPTHFNHSPRCVFCNKNSRRRNTRKGRYWKCHYCGEINPGPGMMKAILGRFTTPPAGIRKVQDGAASPAPAKVAATTIKAAVKAPAKPAKPESTQPVAESKPVTRSQPKPAPASPPPAVKKGGVLEQLAARVYG